ncbi:hypothetical protein [Mycobacterium colombiense]|nr:hypothetical protein [Mycobacterium colombiense]
MSEPTIARFCLGDLDTHDPVARAHAAAAAEATERGLTALRKALHP